MNFLDSLRYDTAYLSEEEFDYLSNEILNYMNGKLSEAKENWEKRKV